MDWPVLVWVLYLTAGLCFILLSSLLAMWINDRNIKRVLKRAERKNALTMDQRSEAIIHAHDPYCPAFTTDQPVAGCEVCELIAQVRADERHLIADTWAASLYWKGKGEPK
jgi:hypothetical protein